MITLALDASTYAGDVAVLRDGDVLAESSVAMRGADVERLMPAVAESLSKAGVVVGDIGRIVCGAGPGSFTSLRIAGAIAKGIASAAGVPLYAVPSMALIVSGAALSAGRYVVAIDALRGEMYVGLFDVGAAGEVAERQPARLVPASDLDAVAAEYLARIISASDVPGAIHAAPHARGVARLEHLLVALGPVDIATWEPSYGRLAEAQVRWEAAHGKALSTA